MGLEAETTCIHGGKPVKVKALLESTELILRGGLKRKLPISSLRNVKASADQLSFDAEGEAYVLNLGAAKAATWAKKINTLPPTLAMKLGLSAGVLAFVIGDVDDTELAAALKDNRCSTLSEAGMTIAVVKSDTQLAAALKIHGKAQAPLWLANVKGAKSPLGENAIRAVMREHGFIDTKTCAVSAILAATRYNKSK
jgi:hypothetical protein